MAVSARPVKELTQSAQNRPEVLGEVVDLRAGGTVLAGTYCYEGDHLVTGWHCHDLHQLEYASEGTVEVETAAGRYLLPPQQAVWIPAGLRHVTTIKHRVRTISVFFDPALLPEPGGRARILAVRPVVREMILYGLRWPIDGGPHDPPASAFFGTLAHLLAESLDEETPLYLPSSTDPLVAPALEYTRRHLDEVTVAQVARAAGVSERTFRRHFQAVLGMSWRSYLLQSRLLAAMALLAESSHTVLDVATEVGFASGSAFSRAFVQRVGETPSRYRARLRAG